MRHTRLVFLLAAGLLAGCSHDDSPSDGGEPDSRADIRFDANVSRMTEGTRAATINSNTDLQTKDLKIDAYFHGTSTKYLDGTKLHYTGSTPAWTFWDGSAALHYYWPIAGSVYEPAGANITFTSLDFVGFCPYEKPAYIGTPTYNPSTGVSFTCDLSSYMTLASQASMQEHLVAVLKEQTLATQTAAAGGALPLTFKHPFALVKFVIMPASGTNVKINSIRIDDLYTGGTCTYNGSTMSWGSYSGSSAMTLVQELKIGTATTQTTPFVVIPNNYGTKYLTVNATWDDWSDVTISDYGADVSFNWKPGYSYTYNLTLDKYGLKVDVAKYTEQW